MRKVLTIILLAFSFLATAQTQPPISQGSKLYQFRNGVKIDSALFLPRKDTGVTDGTMRAPGMLLYRSIDSLLYYMKGNTMTSLTIGADGKFVHYTDTTAMLASRWDSTFVKANFPIDTVSTITIMSAYSGKAKLLYVQDTLQGGLFYQTATGTANGGTVFSGSGGKFWNRSAVKNDGKFNVKWWGAKGDYNITTGTNDATAIQNCINYLATIKTSFFSNTAYRPTLYFPNSNFFLISSPITIPAGINVVADGEIAYNGSNTGGAITIGTPGEINNRAEIKIRLRQRSIPTWVEPQLSSNYGIKIINAQNCKIEIPYVIGFCNNIIFEGDDTGGTTGGFSYNDIVLGTSLDAVRHLTLNCKGTVGWVNENKFNAGNFQNSSSTSTRQESRYGITIRTTSTFVPNNNVFYKPCFQLGYSSLPDKVLDSTVAIFIEKGNINNFYDIRSENSGPILMVCKDLSFGNYAYTNIFGADNKDQLVDLSTSRNNYVISDDAKYSGSISGATQIFNSGFLPEKINKYDTTRYYVQGVSWTRVADGVVYPSGAGVAVSADHVGLTENEGMGVFVETTVSKKFSVKWDVLNQKGGRLLVRLYDGSGNIITPTSTLISPTSMSGNIVSGFGGAYVVGSDRTGRYFYFAVDTSVKKIYVAVKGGTDSLLIKSWQIYSLDNLTAAVYSGLGGKFNNTGISTVKPTEIKPKGTIIYNDLSVSNTPMGWQNYDGSTGWAVIGDTNYIKNQNAVIQSANFYIGGSGSFYKAESNSYAPVIEIQNTGNSRKVGLQLNNNTSSPSLAFWINGRGGGPGGNTMMDVMRLHPYGLVVNDSLPVGAITAYDPGATGIVAGLASVGKTNPGRVRALRGSIGTTPNTTNLELGSYQFGTLTSTTVGTVPNIYADIVTQTSNTWASDNPVDMIFKTTSKAGGPIAERMRIDSNGNVNATADVIARHYISKGTIPTFTPNGATNSILGTGYSFTISGNDTYMYITITTGTGITTSGTIGTIDFNTAYSAAPVSVWSCANINALTTNVVGFNAGTGSGITVFSSANLLPSTTYNYNIITGQ